MKIWNPKIFLSQLEGNMEVILFVLIILAGIYYFITGGKCCSAQIVPVMLVIGLVAKMLGWI